MKRHKKEEIDVTPYRPKPPSPMVQGRAIGGPRDGIKLTAPADWNGIVMFNTVKAHNGKYTWNGKNWTWQSQSTDSDGLPSPRGAAHHKRRKGSLAYWPS